MRLLVVTFRFPTNLLSGDCTTIHHLLRFLSERHQIVFCSPISRPMQGEDHLVAPYCERVETFPLPKWKSLLNCVRGLFSSKPLQTHYFRVDQMGKRIAEIVEKEDIDLVYAYHLRSAQYLPGLKCRTVLDLKPVQTLNLRRMKDHVRNWFKSMLYDAEYRRMRTYEQRAANSADRCLVAAARDQDELGVATNVVVNPHGVNVAYFAPDPLTPKRANNLVFSGRMSYDPNHDAITYFCREVLPLVRKEIPDVTLTIVGKDPKPEVVRLGEVPGIEVTGFVDDMRPYLDQAQVAVNPLRIGAGMQNKVIEAMSMGLPMVLTPVANEGIQARNEEHVVERQSAQAFAAAVVDLLRDEAKRNRIGAAARDYVVNHWSWERHFEDMEQLLEELVYGREETTVPVESPASGLEGVL